MVSKWFLHIAATSPRSVLELVNTNFETDRLQDRFERARTCAQIMEPDPTVPAPYFSYPSGQICGKHPATTLGPFFRARLWTPQMPDSHNISVLLRKKELCFGRHLRSLALVSQYACMTSPTHPTVAVSSCFAPRGHLEPFVSHNDGVLRATMESFWLLLLCPITWNLKSGI
ncbi:hypothetical protein BU26DRAFT_295901 [Trematosphaeria pertusa]|uniref:Uncharacterized protein n=1 Tax=Trematosphaeria pertusa TaxID=390896 RepID=A0A6A6IIR9_9PLEO|nr:uncharacterized protein BU26DRAFT_295901 [Trematosphaeria pertusa]KAF2250119.1 hypothetical protein BU26DRAFT_295901 [Trematosphaeria pertusa]